MTPETQETPNDFIRHDKLRSIKTGFRRKCPSCESAKAFSGYLKLADTCTNCNAPLGQIRADDFPPYLTILLVGHIIVPALIYVEVTYHLSVTTQMILWPSIAMALTLSLLPLLKGAVVGFMWSINMKGDEQH